MDYVAKTWRLELFFKTIKELTTKQLPVLKENNIRRFNITNKRKEDDLVENVLAIKREIPQATVCVHYALKWNYGGGVEAGMAKFHAFLEAMNFLDTSVLLVSGGGKTRPLDTVAALRKLQDTRQRPRTPIHVAYNPYFPKEADVKREQKRMGQKWRTGMVSGIWLQTGSDIKKLEAGLRHLRKLTKAIPVTIYGSFFLPSKRLLAQMKFRPWHGVFLSEEYLSSVESATRITKELLACYRKHNIVPLLETALRSKKDIEEARALMEI